MTGTFRKFEIKYFYYGICCRNFSSCTNGINTEPYRFTNTKIHEKPRI